MKINFLTAAATALLLSGGAVLAQPDTAPPATPLVAPAPAGDAPADQAAAASVCVIGIKLAPHGSGKDATASGAIPPAAGGPPAAQPDVQPGPTAAPAPAPPATKPVPAKGKAPGPGKVPDPSQPGVTNTGAGPTDGKTAAPKLKDLPDEVSESCLGGQIVINVSSRPFGYKIGDVVQVEMEIILKGGAVVDLDPLRQGKLVLDDKGNKGFEVASKPFIQSGEIDGDKAFDIVVPVRTFVPSPTVVFSMQLPYAQAPAPGTAPVWKTLSTPDYTVVQYIEDVKGFKLAMVDGNTGGAAPRIPWLLPIACIIATLLFATWPVILMLRYINRVRTYKTVERRAAAWLALMRVTTSGKEIGFGVTHYRRIAEVLRKYLRVDYPGLDGMTLTEMEQLPDEPRAATIKKAFRKLDRVLVEETPLSAAEQAHFLEELDVLVPRPFTL